MIVFGRSKIPVEQVAAAVASSDPRTLASFLEQLGLQVELQGQGFLGRQLRDQARELRDELSETTVVSFGHSPVRVRAS